MKTRFVVFLLLFTCAFVAQAQMAIIANPSVDEYTFNKDGVQKIYRLEMSTWSNGATIVPFDLKVEGKTQEAFYDLMNRTPLEMRRLWTKAAMAKTGKAPESAGSEDEMVDKVASTPGGIGYVSASKVGKRVKVLMRF